MTTFFARRSVEKAFQLDEQPSGLTLNPHKPLKADPPIITSAVDDIMYIVNKILQQSLATSQIRVVGNVIPTLSRVLGSDFIGMIQRKMRDEYYPRPQVHGGQPAEHTMITFLVLINNLDMAVDYMRRIVQNNSGSDQQLQLQVPVVQQNTEDQQETSVPPTPTTATATTTEHLHALFPVLSDALEATHALQTFQTSFEGKVNELLSDGIQVIFNNVIKHRLRPILADAFRDIEYQPRTTTTSDDMYMQSHDDDDIAEGYYGGSGGDHLIDEGTREIVKPRFTNAWTDLLQPIARILTPSTFDRLLTVTIAYVARLLEKRLWSYHGRVNVLGATRLERDVSGVISAAVDVGGGGNSSSVVGSGSVVPGRYRHREVFMRCLQIVLVMGMEDDEWEDVLRGGEVEEVVDKLSPDERIRARAMVVRR